MKRTFLLDLELVGDTDFLAIADELREAAEAKGFRVLDSRPWKSPQDVPVVPVAAPINPTQPLRPTL